MIGGHSVSTGGGFNQPQIENIWGKNPRKSQKTLNWPHTGNYLHSSFFVLGAVRGDDLTTWGNVRQVSVHFVQQGACAACGLCVRWGTGSQSPADAKGRLICSSLSSDFINRPTKPCVRCVCTGERTQMWLKGAR